MSEYEDYSERDFEALEDALKDADDKIYRLHAVNRDQLDLLKAVIALQYGEPPGSGLRAKIRDLVTKAAPQPIDDQTPF